MTTPIKKSTLPASWQNTDGYNQFYWHVPENKNYMHFEFTLNRACDQPYSIVEGYCFTWERVESNHILVNFGGIK